MHLLAAKPGEIIDGSEAIDLGQSPGEIVVLSAAASDLSVLAQAQGRLDKNHPTLRLANLLELRHNLSVDTYLDATLAHARLITVRLLGGAGYWPYGLDQISELAKKQGIAVAFLPGDDQPDIELTDRSSLPPETCHRLWQYLAQGGMDNAEQFLRYASDIIGYEADWLEPTPLIRSGLYWPGFPNPGIEDIQAQWQQPAPKAAIVFYRALLQAGNLKPVDALITNLQEKRLSPLPIFVSSLKDPVSAEMVSHLLEQAPVDIILNCTGFAISSPGQEKVDTPFDASDCPVLQVIFSGESREGWNDTTRGLTPTDLAMNIALPELDGRVITRAVSFKAPSTYDKSTESNIVEYQPEADRIEFVTDLAAAWIQLRTTNAAERRVGIIVANYPNRDGRLCNGVGLDTPASVARALGQLRSEGYDVGTDIPQDSAALMRTLLRGPTNSGEKRQGGVSYSVEDYQKFFSKMPADVQREISGRWGMPKDDPFVEDGSFTLPVHQFGNCIVAVQPARGYNIDPTATYHDPDLVPPHGYVAFYAWLRTEFCAHAVIHFGKHGNLEWLPGKALALSASCYPEAILGPLPHLYPFIVNDPGEGTQAKRRSQAIVIDHLTPPLTRAESYGPLRDLEQLVDEYYQASGLDQRRLKVLGEEIISLTSRIGLDKDAGIGANDDENMALGKLDSYLCELKEMQIRDGLHEFGAAPTGEQLDDLLVSLTRLPRDGGEGPDQSILRALSRDLSLGEFDPLDADMAEPWEGDRPVQLSKLLTEGSAWRTAGDTIELLEGLAKQLISGETTPDPDWSDTKSVMSFITTQLRPTVVDSGNAETAGLLLGLSGQFVQPGPSGAPSRGRLDVFPTGRNFFGIDSRSIPTPTAWKLGWKSANLLVERYFQDHGEFPRTLAVSAWGTSNMRTGGDDIAQALALMGVRPTWDKNSHRVTGFELMPTSIMDRPRVDVVFRVSGFFRDAFPAQVDLLDSAVRAVAELDEPPDLNPLAANVATHTQNLMQSGVKESEAQRRAGYRVFGSKPGAYGAGIQALIDEKCWDGDADLSRAYVAWGGYAYGNGATGNAEHALFESRLKGVEAVVQNQDNREHDILDSDDYYQFEGGMTAAVRHLSGAQPAIYHNDHSRPESPKIRTLADEIGRVVRARAANPKWINGVMRHGYKGAFEIAATVDYLFAFAATAKVVENHHFEMLFDAYLGDASVRQFIKENNRPALKEMAGRFIEAIDRGFWQPRSNSAIDLLHQLSEGRER